MTKREQQIRRAVRDFWVHDVNKPSWFTEEQNERLIQRLVRAVGEQEQSR
jgi:hypothetical protein